LVQVLPSIGCLRSDTKCQCHCRLSQCRRAAQCQSARPKWAGAMRPVFVIVPQCTHPAIICSRQ
jgi:hypothetical protein